MINITKVQWEPDISITRYTEIIFPKQPIPATIEVNKIISLISNSADAQDQIYQSLNQQFQVQER